MFLEFPDWLEEFILCKILSTPYAYPVKKLLIGYVTNWDYYVRPRSMHFS